MQLGDYAQIQRLQEAGVTAVGLVVMLLKAIQCIVHRKYYWLPYFHAIYSSTFMLYIAVKQMTTLLHLPSSISDQRALFDVKDFSLWLPVLFVAIKTVDRMNFW